MAIFGVVICATLSTSIVAVVHAAEAEPIPRLNITARTDEIPGLRRFTVFFDRNSARITSSARDILTRIVTTINQSGRRNITVTGHTDTLGSRFYNLGLSQRRAMAVQALLAGRGLSDAGMFVYWRGEFEPLIFTGDGVDEFRNRRVEIVVE